MQLRQLEIQGFKSFAGKMRFQFDEGVTAIVGPNGSGKSNLSDSVRWILGEQRPGSLRARKSEDLIFGGTERRPRLGLAQGFITLDNSDGALPIAFSEVVIGRRAYRTGESEYLINGSRVRLRDVQELLAHASIGAGTYTVIGQGLVDAALSLRADERRQLFEDAAGLGAYQGKRDEALRRLTQTEEHLTRVRDILAELEPRLKRLKRQAERTEEYLELRSMLQALLNQFYGFRWGESVEAIGAARAALSQGKTQLHEATGEVVEVERRLEELRQRQLLLRRLLEEQRHQRGRLRAEAERLRRERAVAVERERGFARQQEALQQEVNGLAAERDGLLAQQETLAQEGNRLQAARAVAQAHLTQAQLQLSQAEAARETVRRGLQDARRALGRLTARQAEVAQQRAALASRQQELGREAEAHVQALAELGERLAQREAEAALLQEETNVLSEARARLLAERESEVARRQAAQAAQREAQARLHEVQRRLSGLTARRDLLSRLRQEGAGYGAGVRALLAARHLEQHILGPAAALLRVPDELDTAISAALASELQAVILRGGTDTTRQWLHQSEVGRVMLRPLPTSLPDFARAAPRGAGVIGQAAALVQADHPEVAQMLLGGWIVVETWATVEALDGGADGWDLVTLDGQVRRRDGTVIAGRGEGVESALLAQNREWAELPERLHGVEAEQAEAAALLQTLAETLQTIEQSLATHERALGDNERRGQRAEAARLREHREAERLRQEQAWRQGLLAKSEGERGTLDARDGALGEELAALRGEREAAEARVASAEQEYEALHPGALREAVERARTELAVTDEQLSGWRRNAQSLTDALARLTQRLAAKQQQNEQLEAEGQTLSQRVQALRDEAERAEQALQQGLEQARPQEQEQARNEETLAELEALHLARRKQRQAREEQVHTMQLALHAAEERQAHLREQIEGDLGMAELDEGEALPHQALLPIEELVTSLPRVLVLPEGLENDIRRLRRRLGYLGAINPEAPAEYAEVAERFTFLSEQSDDLARASHDLRHIVAELDGIMEARFARTFEAIDQQFRAYFTRLFNGGQARLELTEPDNLSGTGIEIVARPPGKRAQSIALLSGGERALTAAALIFAILKVSPTPFCVLDEVDAMLDEANIGRFREVLLELAEATQFIVITHNRGTIEAARAIYGISQSDPGISEVLSLQLEQAVAVAKQ